MVIFLKDNDKTVLYLFILFLSIFIISSYIIWIFHSVECYVVMILFYDGLLLYYEDVLRNNSYKLFNITLNFNFFLGIFILSLFIGIVFLKIFDSI